VPLLLVIEVIPCRVMDHRPADIPPELLENIEGPRHSVGSVDRVIRIPDARIAIVIERVGVQLVCSRFRHGVDESRARASIGGIVWILRHLKFLNGLFAENVRHARAAPRASPV